MVARGVSRPLPPTQSCDLSLVLDIEVALIPPLG
jgi:hypothetical protein